MTISEADLELVEQLDRAATRGPWATGKHAGVPNTIVALAAPDVSMLGTESDGQAVFLSKSRTESVSNAEFCAAARDLLPRFAAAHRELAKEVQRIGKINEDLKAESADPELHAFRAGEEAAAAWLEKRADDLEASAELDADPDGLDNVWVASVMEEASGLREAAKAMRKWIKEGDK